MDRATQTLSSKNGLRLLLWAVLILSAFLLFWISRVAHGEANWNAATYLYVGKTILEGGIPYRDAYDVKGPGIYYLFAFSMLLFGKTALGIQILEGIWQALTGLVLARIATRIYKREAIGVIAASLYLIYLLCFATRGGTAEPDRLVSLPSGLGVLFLLEAGEEDRLWRWILAGLTMAVAALLKLPAALLGAVMMFRAMRQGPARFGRVSARLAALAAGFLTPLLLCAVWFYLRGALEDFWTAQFEYAPGYLRRFNAWGSPACLRQNFFLSIHLPLYAMGGLTLVGVVASGRKAWRWPAGLILGWLAVAALGLFLHGLFFAYHFVPLAAPLAILSARAIAGWKEEPAASRLAVVVLTLLFLVMPVIRVPSLLLSSRRAVGEERAAADVWRTLAVSLRARTMPEDTVFLWGNVPAFYLEADRRSPSRFFHSIYLSIDWPGLGTHPQFLADLTAHEPKFFVVNKSGAMGSPCPFSQLDYYAAFRRFAELQRFLEAEYVVEQDTPHYTLYRRKDVAPPGAQRESLDLENDGLAALGAPVDCVGDFDGAQTVVAGCGGGSLAGGGADEGPELLDKASDHGEAVGLQPLLHLKRGEEKPLAAHWPARFVGPGGLREHRRIGSAHAAARAEDFDVEAIATPLAPARLELRNAAVRVFQ